jgi:uncharacterized protein (DUF433 family)
MIFDRITIDPRLMGGVPTICGLRIPVATVVSMVADGMVVEICRILPDLSPEDVSESLWSPRRPCGNDNCRYAPRHDAAVGQYFLSAAYWCAGGGGLDVVHVRKLGLVASHDDIVLQAARDDDRILVSAESTSVRCWPPRVPRTVGGAHPPDHRSTS